MYEVFKKKQKSIPFNIVILYLKVLESDHGLIILKKAFEKFERLINSLLNNSILFNDNVSNSLLNKREKL